MPAMQETRVQSLGWEDPLEKGKATNSSILAWRISLQSMGLQRVTQLRDFHLRVTQLRDFHFSLGHANFFG